MVGMARPHCFRCRRPQEVCLCADIPTLDVRTRFVFLTHPKEAKKTKNGTGRLAHLALPGSEVLVGVDFREHPRVNALIREGGCWLLYPAAPGKGAGASGAPRVLFVLDATWPCAKKMMTQSTNLHGLPRLSLDVDRPSEFVTKHQPDPRCLATIEAVDRTLWALTKTGEERWDAERSEALLRPFRRMNDIALEFARNPPPGSYRRSGPFRRPESRPGRSSKATGRNIVFLG